MAFRAVGTAFLRLRQAALWSQNWQSAGTLMALEKGPQARASLCLSLIILLWSTLDIKKSITSHLWIFSPELRIKIGKYSLKNLPVLFII